MNYVVPAICALLLLLVLFLVKAPGLNKKDCFDLSRVKLIDLTHTLEADIPTWRGEPDFFSTMVVDYPQGTSRVHTYTVGGGIGTHIDAPVHFIPDAASVAEVQLQNLLAPLHIINVAHLVDSDDFLIQPHHILEYEKKYGAITPRSFVAGYTGWSKRWPDSKLYRNIDSHNVKHFPGFSLQAAELLLQRNVVGLGIDTLSTDGGNTKFPVLYKVLGAGKYTIHNLAHLD